MIIKAFISHTNKLTGTKLQRATHKQNYIPIYKTQKANCIIISLRFPIRHYFALSLASNTCKIKANASKITKSKVLHVAENILKRNHQQVIKLKSRKVCALLQRLTFFIHGISEWTNLRILL